MADLPRDPWVDVNTAHGFAADQVISALQKEIRRSNTENAALLAYEMVITSPALEDYLWYRLMVISVEDVGFGQPEAPMMINALNQMLSTFDRGVGERQLFAIHAVRYLCGCQKDRSSDEMVIWIKRAVASGEVKAQIPEYALDMHTAVGQQKGRGRSHFFHEAAKISPAHPERDTSYRKRILAMLENGQLT